MRTGTYLAMLLLGMSIALTSCEKEPKPVPVTGISLDSSSLTLTEGETARLAATISPSNADNQGVIWSSSDASVATVSNGTVTAVAAGYATITAKSDDGGKTATCNVTVNPKAISVTGVNLNKTMLVLTEGDEYTLVATVIPEDATNKNITWSISDERIISVSNGTVFAINAGIAEIQVKTEDGGKTAKCIIIVNSIPSPIDGALSGKFSVSSTKQVYFSMGNLQATYSGSSYTWGFAENQYDMVGDSVGNISIDNQTANAKVDLFGWSTDATYYGIDISDDDEDYSGNFKEWGIVFGKNSPWRTLSLDEWCYLFGMSLFKSYDEQWGEYYEYYGHDASHPRYRKIGLATVNNIRGLVVLPDDWDTPSGCSFFPSTFDEEGYNTSAGYSDNTYSLTNWKAMEAKGAVFLPSANYRESDYVEYFGSDGDTGYYWTSTAKGAIRAGFIYLGSEGVTGDWEYRAYGQSVRLVKDVE